MIKKPKIYIVDDDSTARTILTAALSKKWQTASCRNGEEFMEELKKYDEPAVILLDINMPKMNGLDVIKQLKEHDTYKEYPVIFITGHSSKKTELKCLQEGASDYIAKPFNPHVVFQRVNNVVEQYVAYTNFSELYAPDAALMQEGYDKLDKAYKKVTYQVLTSLSSTIDAKDYYTRGHSTRVADYSTIIGIPAGLSREELDILYHCALLHDIGKIGVSDVILRKKNKLTDAEYNVIKKHPVTGYNILKTITLMPDMAKSARWHHERFDGTGYPDGLKGLDIPIFARIIAVADSFDAMTSDRAYRKGLPIETARRELIANSGTQFDPELVKILVAAIDAGDIKGRESGNRELYRL